MDINNYMRQGSIRLAQTAPRFYRKSSTGKRFMARIIKRMYGNMAVRGEYESQGLHVPPFLIASIASECNLDCPGCYAFAGGICKTVPSADNLSCAEWERIFKEASALGVSFILLAGGEPLMRSDVIHMAASCTDVIFPIFTNGTLIDDAYIGFFEENRNMIPVLSVEGDAPQTDARRGQGVSEKLDAVMERMKRLDLFQAVSITVTTENLRIVTDTEYLKELKRKGCGLVFYIEYVPAEKGTGHLVLSQQQVDQFDQSLAQLKRTFPSMGLVAFPGNEKFMGGCLAAGRGFFHINPAGNAEPCPFSPFSVMNLKNHTIEEVLRSPFFARVRKIGAREADNHNGGCTLFNFEAEVKDIHGTV